ncbi:MAG: hypothetical protein QM784_13290 [Polyangiaceae bacterium]
MNGLVMHPGVTRNHESSNGLDVCPEVFVDDDERTILRRIGKLRHRRKSRWIERQRKRHVAALGAKQNRLETDAERELFTFDASDGLETIREPTRTMYPEIRSGCAGKEKAMPETRGRFNDVELTRGG